MLILRQKYKVSLRTFNKILRLFSRLKTKFIDLSYNSIKRIILKFRKRLRKFKCFKFKWEKLISKVFPIQFSLLAIFLKIQFNKVAKANIKPISTISYILLNSLWKNRCLNFNQENFLAKGQNHIKTCKTSRVTSSVSLLKAKHFKPRCNFKEAAISAKND